MYDTLHKVDRMGIEPTTPTLQKSVAPVGVPAQRNTGEIRTHVDRICNPTPIHSATVSYDYMSDRLIIVNIDQTSHFPQKSKPINNN